MDLNLKFLSCIPFKRLNKPRDVAVASDGAIYVSDTGNNCIKVCRKLNDGNIIIEKFGNNNKNKLEQPAGICIYKNKNSDVEYVLVAGHKTSRVFVFKSSGEFVTSIGKENTGKVIDLYGINVDSDGNVYAVGYAGHHVKKFKLQDYLV